MATNHSKWVIVSICLPQVFLVVRLHTTTLVCRPIWDTQKFYLPFWFVVRLSLNRQRFFFLGCQRAPQTSVHGRPNCGQTSNSLPEEMGAESHSRYGWWGQTAGDKNQTPNVSDTICWLFCIGDTMTKRLGDWDLQAVTQPLFYWTVATMKKITALLHKTTTECALTENRLHSDN